MRILLFGKNGQLGSELCRSLLSLGPILAVDKDDLDLADSDSLKKFIIDSAPDVIINASAYTAVDRAESEPGLAYAINAIAPGMMARAAGDLDAVFIHFSTDYVFDGMKGSPYTEDDEPNPLNVYGRSKLEGEQLVMKAGGTALVFRTSWVYSLTGDSFLTKTLAWARQHETLRIVEDQVGSPTWARFLAGVTSALLARADHAPFRYFASRKGIYHLAGKGAVSRFEFTRQVLALDPRRTEQRCKEILPARTDEFPTPARRPLFSALDCSRFENTFGLFIADWKETLALALV
jgi:dTDP-4-dehydrorhamnose reductase